LIRRLMKRWLTIWPVVKALLQTATINRHDY
jgi:hypothetical protein